MDSHWYVQCADLFGRGRAMTVLADDDDVLVVSPAGGSAVLSIAETRQLDEALTQAAVNAFRSNG